MEDRDSSRKREIIPKRSKVMEENDRNLLVSLLYENKKTRDLFETIALPC